VGDACPTFSLQKASALREQPAATSSARKTGSPRLRLGVGFGKRPFLLRPAFVPPPT
jgi:hypothetical protein